LSDRPGRKAQGRNISSEYAVGADHDRQTAGSVESNIGVALSDLGKQLRFPNVRSAGDTSIGVALTLGAVPLLKCLSLYKDCRGHVRQALGALRTGATSGGREEMRLHAELGVTSDDASERAAELTRTLELAESFRDTEYQLRALQGLFLCNAGGARYHLALTFAEKFRDLASTASDASDRLVGEHVMGLAKHFLGDQIGARRHLEQVLSYDGITAHRRYLIRYQIGLRVSASAFLARAQWLQGFPEQAVRTAEKSIEEAQAIGHALSLCYTLALAACPIALWVGDLTAAKRYTEMLLDHSLLQATEMPWLFGSMFEGIIRKKGGQVDEGLRLRSPGQVGIANPFWNLQIMTGLIASAEHVTPAHTEERVERFEGDWLAPELLRIKGEHALLQSAPLAAEAAERHFRLALDLARRQGTLSWELRAAISLSRLLRHHGGHADAMAVLQPVYDQFTEGFETADLIAAKHLLSEPSGR
jgi:hypothetical protein